MNFATVLVTIRNTERLTQEELGQKIGISQAAVSHLEGGQRLPTIGTLRKLMDTYDTHIVRAYIDQELGQTGRLFYKEEPKTLTQKDVAIDVLVSTLKNSPITEEEVIALVAYLEVRLRSNAATPLKEVKPPIRRGCE